MYDMINRTKLIQIHAMGSRKPIIASIEQHWLRCSIDNDVSIEQHWLRCGIDNDVSMEQH